MTLDDLANDLIFEPLAMTDMHFYWDAPLEDARFAKEYSADGSIHASERTTPANAVANLLTTVGDYSKFMLHIMSGADLRYWNGYLCSGPAALSGAAGQRIIDIETQ